MTVYMPPILRKKKVDERYNPDSFRVISTDAEDTHPRYSPRSYRASFQPPTPDEQLLPDIKCGRTRVLPKPTADFRANNPQPLSCSFIRTNVALLNEPICTVHTKETHHEQNRWWPARANKGTLEKGEHTLDTMYRGDFLYTYRLAPQPSFRHSANPNTDATRGIAPVNYLREEGGQQGFFKEGLSFDHQYDSRSDPSYPIRGKRHGAFVYSKMNTEAKQKFINRHLNHNSSSSNQEKQTRGGATSQPPPDPRKHCQWPPSQPQQLCAKSAPAHKAPAATEMLPNAGVAKEASPEMLQTRSSPMEWYNPETDNLKNFGRDSTKPAQQPRSAPLQERCQQSVSTRSQAKNPSPEMLQTRSSPMEWYNPETDTLRHFGAAKSTQHPCTTRQ